MTNKRIVDFLICGTQKGGTTALDSYLREHPSICMANRKEVHYFDNEENFKEGAPNYSDYHSQFTPSPHQIVGESTPIYMYWKNSIERIFQYKPEMKIIVTLRNPITRAYSHWNMEVNRGNDDIEFSEAIRNERERCVAASPMQHRVYSYCDRGFYSEQIETIFKYFPKKQVLILKNEDLRRSPTETLNRICSFLNISEFETVYHIEKHSIPYSEQINSQDKQYLIDLYREDIFKIEKMLSWNCKHWIS